MDAKTLQSQKIFQTSYRGRQSRLHHMSYMRMSKVLLTLRVLDRAGIALEGCDLFDYGFGAGTFFKYCPPSARLYGVEIDPQHVAALQALYARTHAKADLQPIRIANWRQHPLLERQYDVVLCSHVLEHLEDPVDYLRVIKECLKEQGRFVGLVPINERADNPHHLHTVDRAVVGDWARAAGLRVSYYVEADPWLYWIQPLYTAEGISGLRHRLAQAFSLMLGVPATALGPEAWARASERFATLTRSRPTQAAFVLRDDAPRGTDPPHDEQRAAPETPRLTREAAAQQLRYRFHDSSP